jgi:hypothetical protein
VRHSWAQAMIAGLGDKFRKLRGARGVPLAAPPIIGFGTGGGFSYVLQDTGGNSPQALSQVPRGLLMAAIEDPQAFAIPALYVTFQVIRERRSSARPKERRIAGESGVAVGEHVPGPIH